jgi:surface-anchored protein
MNRLKKQNGFLELLAIGLMLGENRGRAADLIETGHYDLNVTFTNGFGWVFNWYNFDNEERIPTKFMDIGLTEAARTTVPASGFSALGAAAGDPVWIIPQGLTPGVIFLGYRTQDAEQSEFSSPFGTPFIGLKVTDVRGSGVDRGGYFTAYQTGVEAPVFQFTSANGFDNTDVVAPIPLTAHAHYNWAFTRPGEYQVKFEAEGDHRTGVVTNGSDSFTFFVPGGMTNLQILDNGHMDLRLGFDGTNLRMAIRSDVDAIPGAYDLKERPLEEVVFHNQASDLELTIPSNPAFSFLGAAGEKVWAFPQSFDSDVIFFGINARDVTQPQDLQGDLALKLQGVTGPTNGHFFLFQVDALGAPIVYMDSSDGIDPEVDLLLFSGTGHDHYFWAFSTTGLYQVAFQLAATNTTGTPITSRIYETQFGVGALPGFRDDDGNGIDDHWEARHGFTSPADPTADLDGDNKSNLNEYLFDTDPRMADTNAPVFRVITNSSSSVSLEADTLEGRQYRLMYSEDLRTWKPGSEKILGQRARLPFFDDGKGLIQGAPTNRFYRLDISSPR